MELYVQAKQESNRCVWRPLKPKKDTNNTLNGIVPKCGGVSNAGRRRGPAECRAGVRDVDSTSDNAQKCSGVEEAKWKE